MSDTSQSSLDDVPLGSGPPTHEEIARYYPPKFTWEQLKLFINSGDLGLLKRNKALQDRYDIWSRGIKNEYGSLVDYLLDQRLQWGKHDKISLLKSSLKDEDRSTIQNGDAHPNPSDVGPKYFSADTPPHLICITQNDWPYSTPLDVEHSLIWTKLPILPPPYLIPPAIAENISPELRERVQKRLEQDGIWGFTGNDAQPPSPSLLPQSLGRLSEWGITIDKLIISPKGASEEEEIVRLAGSEVQKFVTSRWTEDEWETAWFVNPPRLQSVKGLAHVHVFARRKT